MLLQCVCKRNSVGDTPGVVTNGDCIGAELSFRLIQGGWVAPPNDKTSSFIGKRQRRCQPNADIPSGNQRGLAFESFYNNPSYRSAKY